MTDPPEKILIISEMGIGDALTLLPAISALKSLHPDLLIEMIAPGLFPLRANITRLIKFMDPQSVPDTPPERMAWMQQFTYIWNTENERSPWKPLIDQAENPNWISAPAHRTWPARPVLQLRLEQLGVLFSDIESNDYPSIDLTKIQQPNNWTPTCKAFTRIAIQPGAKDKTKCWPLAKFHQLIELLLEHPKTEVRLFLTPDEMKQWHKLPVIINERLILISEPLDQLLPTLASCRLFIGNDSGFYHLSHALGLSVIGLFRSRHNMKVWSYRSNRSTALCFWLPSPIRQYWHHFIPVNRVKRTAERMLSRLFHL